MKRSLLVFWMVLVFFSLTFVIAGCKESMKDLYQKAMKAYQKEDYQKAAELFEVILQKYPDHNLSRKARYELGKIYLYKLQQPYKALEHLQNLYAQSHPGKYSLEALKLIGYIYEHSLNECLKGVEAYRILLQEYPLQIEADKYQYAIAECYFKVHDYEQAMAEYIRVVEQYPESSYRSRATFQIANSYALQENWEQAITIYEELLGSDTLPEQLIVDIKLELAFSYEHQEDFEKALKLYLELQAIDPNEVIIDITSLARKIERVHESIAESQKGPSKVEWERKKK